jgi:hypothetical protein
MQNEPKYPHFSPKNNDHNEKRIQTNPNELDSSSFAPTLRIHGFCGGKPNLPSVLCMKNFLIMAFFTLTLSTTQDYNRTHTKICFVTRSSDKSVVKTGGEKGSEVCRCTLRTFFTDNADPRALQPIAIERGFGMGSRYPPKFHA